MNMKRSGATTTQERPAKRPRQTSTSQHTPLSDNDSDAPASSRTLSIEPDESSGQRDACKNHGVSGENDANVLDQWSHLPLCEVYEMATNGVDYVRTKEEQELLDTMMEEAIQYDKSRAEAVSEEGVLKPEEATDAAQQGESPGIPSRRNEEEELSPGWEHVPVQVVCCMPAAAYPELTQQAREELERAANMPIPDGDSDDEDEDEDEAVRRREVEEQKQQVAEEEPVNDDDDDDETPIVQAICCVGSGYVPTQRDIEEMEAAMRMPLPDEE